MKLPLSTVTGKIFYVEVDPNCSIFQVKKEIEKINHFPISKIKLIYKAHVLEDDKKLYDLELNKNSDSLIFMHVTHLRAMRPKQPPPHVIENMNKNENVDSQKPNAAEDKIETNLNSAQFDSSPSSPHSSPISKINQNKSIPTMRNNMPSMNQPSRNNHQIGRPDTNSNLRAHNSKPQIPHSHSGFNQQTRQISTNSNRQNHQVHSSSNQNLSQTFNSRSNDPPDFNTNVQNLVDMGFERSQCEQALRISGYNPNAAASLLLSGNLAMLQGNSNPNISSNTRQQLNRLNQQQQQHSPPTISIDQDDDRHVIENIYNSLTSNDHISLRRLNNEFREIGYRTILDVFIACDKNEETAIDVLRSM